MSDTEAEKKDGVEEVKSVEEVRVEAIDPDAAKREGIKEEATNPDGMAIDKDKVAPEKVALPSFFIKKSDRHKIEVDILSSKKDGRIMSVSRVGLGLDFKKDFSYLRHDVMWFEFSVPNYEDMSTYRQRSSVWRRDAQQTIIDKLQLRNFLLVWHLKDWSLTDSDGNKVELEIEEKGALTDESVAKVYALNPTMVDVVLTLLEKDILLT